MRGLLREPLLHFLAIGGLLFVLAAILRDPDDGPSQVVVTAGAIEQLTETFQLAWHRAPSDAKLAALVDDRIKEELYYREAVAMGLDRNDEIVKRRLRQKLEFLAADLAGGTEPTEQDLQSWLDAHAESYRTSARVDLVQVYLGQEDTGAAATLDALRAGADPRGLGRPLHVPASFRDADTALVVATFGQEFSDAVATVPVGEWSGPVTSGYGLHLVRVDRRVPGEVPPLDVVRDEVLRDVSAERRREAEQVFYEGLRARYEVRVEWPSPDR